MNEVNHGGDPRPKPVGGQLKHLILEPLVIVIPLVVLKHFARGG